MVLDVSPSLSIAMPLKKNLTVCQVVTLNGSKTGMDLTKRPKSLPNRSFRAEAKSRHPIT